MKQVLYPGLPSHPQHELAKRQMRGFGGMISFDVGTLEAAHRRVQARPADGARREPGRRRDADFASGIDDACVGAARAPRAIGLTDSLVRISAGIEDPADLIEDLSRRYESELMRRS